MTQIARTLRELHVDSLLDLCNSDWQKCCASGIGRGPVQFGLEATGTNFPKWSTS